MLVIEIQPKKIFVFLWQQQKISNSAATGFWGRAPVVSHKPLKRPVRCHIAAPDSLSDAAACT